MILSIANSPTLLNLSSNLCDRIAGGVLAIAVILDSLAGQSRASQARRIVEIAGGLDILHANLEAHVRGDVIDGDPDRGDRMLDLDVKTALRSIHAVLGDLRDHGSGDIIVTSSIAGVIPVVREPIHAASKHAVRAFVHSTRRPGRETRHPRRRGPARPGLDRAACRLSEGEDGEGTCERQPDGGTGGLGLHPLRADPAAPCHHKRHRDPARQHRPERRP